MYKTVIYCVKNVKTKEAFKDKFILEPCADPGVFVRGVQVRLTELVSHDGLRKAFSDMDYHGDFALVKMVFYRPCNTCIRGR